MRRDLNLVGAKRISLGDLADRQQGNSLPDDIYFPGGPSTWYRFRRLR